MVTILHTADVHLDPSAAERREGLERVLSLADDEAVDLLTIGGDLFNSEVDAEELRNSLRELFSDRNYPILTIPGNHDVDAFRGNLVFGENFQPVTDEPYHHVSAAGDIRVTCLPYTPQATDDLLIALAERDSFEGTEALLLHCSLEAPVQGGVGEESEERYFPIGKEALAELDYDYYLAGHYHQNHRAELSNGGTFVYPGTPTSVTHSETQPRTVAFVDTAAGQEVRLEQLDTFHYDELTRQVTPGDEDDVIEVIDEQVETWADRSVEAEITLDGYTMMDENDFDTAVGDAAGDISVDNNTKTAEHILSHSLFQDFEAELAQRDEPEALQAHDDYDPDQFQTEIWDHTLEVFATLSAEGTL